jgi:hypothetical protein
MPPPLTWQISQWLTIFPQLFMSMFLISYVEIAFLVMLYTAISMSLKLREKT